MGPKKQQASARSQSRFQLRDSPSQDAGTNSENSSDEEVQLTTAASPHSPRATRSRVARRAETPPPDKMAISEEEGSEEEASDFPDAVATPEDAGELRDSDDEPTRNAAARIADPEERRHCIHILRNRWTVPNAKFLYSDGFGKRSEGFQHRALIPEVQLVTDNLQAILGIMELFERNRFWWMGRAPGYYGPLITQEFYSAYAAMLIDSITANVPKHQKKTMAMAKPPLEFVEMRGIRIDISENTINRFLQGSDEYVPPHSGLYEQRHHYATDEARMSNPAQRTEVLTWIAQQIAIEGADVAWVTDPHVKISKASLSFHAKVWWLVVRSRLKPTTNDNSLSPAQASLVACIMARYDINAGRLIATELRDRALNERAGLPFPSLIMRLAARAQLPTSRYVDRRLTYPKVSNIALIRDINNPLTRTPANRSAAPFIIPPGQPPLNVSGDAVPSDQPGAEGPGPTHAGPGQYCNVPYEFLTKLVADHRQTRAIVDQIVERLPQVIQTHIQQERDQFQKEIRVLQQRIDSLEAYFTSWFGSLDPIEANNILQQLAVLQAEIAELKAKSSQQAPTPHPADLMNLFTEPVQTTLDQAWGMPPPQQTAKRDRKGKKTSDQQDTPADPEKEARRREKQLRKESRRLEREREAAMQQEIENRKMGESGSRPPPPGGDSHPQADA